MIAVEVFENDCIYNIGDRSSCIYFLEKGILDVRLPTHEEGEFVTPWGIDLQRSSVIHSGSIFGEYGFFSGDNRASNIITLQKGVLHILDRMSYSEQTKINRLQQMPFFKSVSLSSTKIENIAKLMQVHVYYEGEKIDNFCDIYLLFFFVIKVKVFHA